MAAIYDFTVPMTLTSPLGTLALNQQVALGGGLNGFFLCVNKSSDSGAEMRVSRDDVPQASGEIQHLHYKSGYEMRLHMQFWERSGDEGLPACGETLVLMADLLQKHLNALVDDDPIRPLSIVADPLGLTRIQWTPAGAANDRMLDKIRLLERPAMQPSQEDDVVYEVGFALMSDRPYAMDAPQTVTPLGGPIPNSCPGVVGGVCPDAGLSGPNPVTITNGGTSDFYPVTRVYGPFNTFALKNLSLLDVNGQPLQIVYDAINNPGSNSVGSGHYIEIDHWANTVYLDGSVADYMAGITIMQSDFWQLQPGANNIQIAGGYTGAGAAVLWQNAWA